MIRTFLACSLMAVVFVSCYQDEENTNTLVIKNPPRTIIQQSEMVVNVSDENGNDLVGLTASFNNDIKVVDKLPFFHFNGNKINKYEELLQITDKEGNKFDYILVLI